MERFGTPAEMLDWFRDKPVGTQCILTGPRSATQKNQLYRSARRKGQRVGFEELESGDCLITKTADLGVEHGRTLKKSDNLKEKRSLYSHKPEGDHQIPLSAIAEMEIGETWRFTQNEKNLLRDAKKFGVKVSIHRCDGYREVTRVE